MRITSLPKTGGSYSYLVQSDYGINIFILKLTETILAIWQFNNEYAATAVAQEIADIVAKNSASNSLKGAELVFDSENVEHDYRQAILRMPARFAREYPNNRSAVD